MWSEAVRCISYRAVRNATQARLCRNAVLHGREGGNSVAMLPGLELRHGRTDQEDKRRAGGVAGPTAPQSPAACPRLLTGRLPDRLLPCVDCHARTAASAATVRAEIMRRSCSAMAAAPTCQRGATLA